MRVALNPSLTPEQLTAYLRHGKTYRDALDNPVLPFLLVEHPALAEAVAEARDRRIRDDAAEACMHLEPAGILTLEGRWRNRGFRLDFGEFERAKSFVIATGRAGYYAHCAMHKSVDDDDRADNLRTARGALFSAFKLFYPIVGGEALLAELIAEGVDDAR